MHEYLFEVFQHKPHNLNPKLTVHPLNFEYKERPHEVSNQSLHPTKILIFIIIKFVHNGLGQF